MSKDTKDKPKMVRINFDVPEELRNDVKAHFAKQGKSLTDGCRDLLCKELATTPKTKKAA
jgi:hypothetical protein